MVLLVSCRWELSAEQVEVLQSLVVDQGLSVRAASMVMNARYDRCLEVARERSWPIRRKPHVSAQVKTQIEELLAAGFPPMQVARQLDVGPTVVYLVGISTGYWEQMGLGVRSTKRRCEYLRLRRSGMGRSNACRAAGIDVRTGLDWDKGLTKLRGRRVPFIPAGAQAGVYKRLMYLTTYVDGQVSVPVPELPVTRVNQVISRRYLSAAERERIADLRREGSSIRQIAGQLGRSPSTISREIRRNSDDYDLYRPFEAHRKSVYARLRPKIPKLVAHPTLRALVEQKLQRRWSPEQIAAWLRRRFPDQDTMWVSHETIYQALYIQARGSLKVEVKNALRSGRATRKPATGRPTRQRYSDEMINISERPPEAEDRAVPGHWEGDLIIGAGGRSAIGTLVERTTRYTMLVHLPGGHDAITMKNALVDTIGGLPGHLRVSLTWDQGSEMAGHKAFTIDTGTQVYFCDPGSPWQRGTNENTNGLLRQYFPKGTDLSVHTTADLEYVAAELNGRPRKTLNWKTPAEQLQQLLDSPDE